MADVNLVSYSVIDATGVVKSIPIYFPVGLSIANIQAGADALASAIDNVIDGVIQRYDVTLQLVKASGLKGTPGPQVARMGALLDYDAVATAYRHGIFIPTWKEAGFSGNVAVTTGLYNTLEALIASGGGIGGSELKPSDRYANDLVAFLKGTRRFRK